ASIKKGQSIRVYVARVNDAEGTVILSKKKVDAIEGLEKIAAAKENGMEVKVKVTDVVKGGLVAVAHGVRVFIPASQVSDRFVQDLNEYLKQVFTVNIIEVDRQKRKIVGSRKAIVEKERKAKMDSFWEDVQIGKTFKGTVKSLTDFGAFVDIGGVDGLIHISELSWNKIKHPSQVVKVGDA
ncbi:S1 RNA-binding domain-containing protein, partial [Cutibacterium acnes]